MSEDSQKEKKLFITEGYLKELIDYVSRSLCGKLLKRFEIIENKDVIKTNAKELIYEEFRQLRDLIIAHNRGLDIKIFKFKRGEEKPT